MSLAEVDDSVDRIVAGMEGTPMVDSKSKSLVAYHEVGHAVCGTLTPGELHLYQKPPVYWPRIRTYWAVLAIPKAEAGVCLTYRRSHCFDAQLLSCHVFLR